MSLYRQPDGTVLSSDEQVAKLDRALSECLNNKSCSEELSLAYISIDTMKAQISNLELENKQLREDAKAKNYGGRNES